MGKKLIAGMYGRFVHPPVYSSEQIREEMARYLTAVFAWTSACLLAAGLCATWVGTTPNMNPGLLEGYAPVFSVVCSFFLFTFTAGYLSKSSTAACILCCLYWCAIGCSLALLVRAYAGVSVGSVFMSAAAVFWALAIHQKYGGRALSFSSVDAYLLGAVTLAIVSGVYAYLRAPWSDHMFVIVGVAGSLYVVVANLTHIRAQNRMGNEGTAEDLLERMSGSLLVYLHIVMFLAVVLSHAPKKAGGNKGSRRGFGGGSFGVGGVKGKW